MFVQEKTYKEKGRIAVMVSGFLFVNGREDCPQESQHSHQHR